VPQLSLQQEVQLAETIESAGEEAPVAQRQLVEANLGLVVTIVQECGATGIRALDQIERGNVGLIKAARSFRAGKGYKFSTLATFWVNRSLGEH
jgi:RNA polymerase primary sigma factor